MLRRTSTFLQSITEQQQTKNKTILVSYLCDIEGCYDFWDRFLSHSKVLCRPSKKRSSNPSVLEHDPLDVDFRLLNGEEENDNKINEKKKKKNNNKNYETHFVFGGDAFDKGNGDIRLFRDLISLQDRYPDRVHFVLGNRDTNKLKLLTELNPAFKKDHVVPKPYYLPDQHFVSFEDFERKLKSQQKKSGKADDQDEEVVLLKYLLKHRMGSGDLFEFRRQELALGFQPHLDSNNNNNNNNNNIKKDDKEEEGEVVRDPRSVSDREVLESFQIMTQPRTGIYSEFCRRGRLAVLLGDTAFVHGSINDGNIGIVPDLSMREHTYAVSKEVPPLLKMKTHKNSFDISEWFAELERFKTDSMSEIEAIPEFKSQFSSSPRRRGGAAFFGYGHGRCIGDATVEVSTYLRGGRVQHLGPVAAAYLAMNGVRRVVVGHQPVGDTPLLIQQPGDVTVVMADTSYGDKPGLKGPNGRGEAVSEVLLTCNDQDDDDDVFENEFENNFEKTESADHVSSSFSSSFSSGTARVHGLTSKGTEFDFDVHHPLSGRVAKDDWWFVGASAKSVLARRTKDAFRNYEQKWLDHQEAEQLVHSLSSSSAGHHFFEPETQRNFESPIPDSLLKKNPTVVTRGEGESAAFKSQVRPKNQE